MAGLNLKEVQIVKAFLAQTTLNDQQILAHFTHPARSINHRLIGQIRKGSRYADATVASADELAQFRTEWPLSNPAFASAQPDERLLRAKVTMIAAVRAFNSAGSDFRTEHFVVTAIIAWTYLIHYMLEIVGVDVRFRHPDTGAVLLTKHGQEKFWDLSRCLAHAPCPVDPGTKANLELLVEVRNEVEHRNSGSVDEALSPYFQACCINFERCITGILGKQHSLERTLRLALQFARFSDDQFRQLSAVSDLPDYLKRITSDFAQTRGEAMFNDPHFRMKVYYQAKSANHPGTADEIVSFIKEDIADASKVSRVLIREVEKGKHKPSAIVEQLREAGYPLFGMTHHTNLWKQLDAKNAKYRFGTNMSDGQWYWYDSWLERVKSHCIENAERYGFDAG